MFKSWRFKRRYAAFKKQHLDSLTGEWALEAKDLLELVNAFPVSLLAQKGQLPGAIASRYVGQFYHASLHDLLTNTNAIVAIMSQAKTSDENGYLGAEHKRPTALRRGTASWMFGDGEVLTCDSALMQIQESLQALIDGLEVAGAERGPYFMRQSTNVLFDFVGAIEILAEVAVGGVTTR